MVLTFPVCEDHHPAERCDLNDQGEDGKAYPQRHPDQHRQWEGQASEQWFPRFNAWITYSIYCNIKINKQ